jgi:hypothetical protein
MVSLVYHQFVRSIRELKSGFSTIDAHGLSRGLLPWICCAHRGPCCQPVVAAALAAYLKEEQPMMTVVLIYMSGFLVVVAALLVAMIKTTAHPNR